MRNETKVALAQAVEIGSYHVNFFSDGAIRRWAIRVIAQKLDQYNCPDDGSNRPWAIRLQEIIVDLESERPNMIRVELATMGLAAPLRGDYYSIDRRSVEELHRGIQGGGHGIMSDTTRCERPWCLCDVGDDGLRLNYGHPLIWHLLDDMREELVTDVAEFMDSMACVEQEWIDSSDAEAKRWQSPLEFLVNNWAWGWMERHPEWMEATVDAVLSSAGLAPQGLAYFDEGDHYNLASSLAAAATQALRNGWDARESLRKGSSSGYKTGRRLTRRTSPR